MKENYSHGGNITGAAQKYNLSEHEIIDFSASINPLGPSPMVYKVLSEGLRRIRHYPEPYGGKLPAILSEYLGIESENLLLGNGSAEIIYTLPLALNIKKALVLAPTFSLYAKAIEANGGMVTYEFRSLEDRKVFFQEPEKRLAGFDALFLCNPNNPTGQLISTRELLPLLEASESSDTLMIIDEAFIDFVEDKDNYSVLRLTDKYKNLIVLYSMTKFFGFPGLRLGAAIASLNLIGKIKPLIDPWSVNALALTAGAAAVEDKNHIDATLEVIKKEREFLFSALSKIPGFKPYPPSANFLLVDISKTGTTSWDLADKMAKKGILIRDCSNFLGLNHRYIRLAVRNRDDNNLLIDALYKEL